MWYRYIYSLPIKNIHGNTTQQLPASAELFLGIQDNGVYLHMIWSLKLVSELGDKNTVYKFNVSINLNKHRKSILIYFYKEISFENNEKIPFWTEMSHLKMLF